MTDPTPTRAEVEAYPEIIWIGTDALQNDDEGCHVTYDPEATHIGYVRLDVHEALRERAEAAERSRDDFIEVTMKQSEQIIQLEFALTKARAGTVRQAAKLLLLSHQSGDWQLGNGRTVEQVATVVGALQSIALRRAAPTEGEA